MNTPPIKYDFVVGCLPRSGSAWLANVMNMDDRIFCAHEGIGRPPIIHKNRWCWLGTIGSDAFMLKNTDEMTSYFYIERDEEEAARSLAKAGVFSLQRWKNILKARDEWVEDFSPVMLDYNNLDLAVSEIFGALSQTGFSPEKLTQARSLRVTSSLYPDSI